MIDDAGSSGTLLLSATYDSFGEEYASPTTYYTDAYDGFGAQWGYFQDQSENLELLGHRFYDEVNGRFINRDPIRYRGGLNIYEYANDSAPVHGDPFGFMSIIVGDPSYPVFCFGSCEDPGNPTVVLNYNGASPFYSCLGGAIGGAYGLPTGIGLGAGGLAG
jgi:RHS repeat-associated protein